MRNFGYDPPRRAKPTPAQQAREEAEKNRTIFIGKLTLARNES